MPELDDLRLAAEFAEAAGLPTAQADRSAYQLALDQATADSRAAAKARVAHGVRAGTIPAAMAADSERSMTDTALQMRMAPSQAEQQAAQEGQERTWLGAVPRGLYHGGKMIVDPLRVAAQHVTGIGEGISAEDVEDRRLESIRAANTAPVAGFVENAAAVVPSLVPMMMTGGLAGLPAAAQGAGALSRAGAIISRAGGTAVSMAIPMTAETAINLGANHPEMSNSEIIARSVGVGVGAAVTAEAAGALPNPFAAAPAAKILSPANTSVGITAPARLAMPTVGQSAERVAGSAAVEASKGGLGGVGMAGAQATFDPDTKFSDVVGPNVAAGVGLGGALGGGHRLLMERAARPVVRQTEAEWQRATVEQNRRMAGTEAQNAQLQQRELDVEAAARENPQVEGEDPGSSAVPRVDRRAAAADNAARARQAIVDQQEAWLQGELERQAPYERAAYEKQQAEQQAAAEAKRAADVEAERKAVYERGQKVAMAELERREAEMRQLPVETAEDIQARAELQESLDAERTRISSPYQPTPVEPPKAAPNAPTPAPEAGRRTRTANPLDALPPLPDAGDGAAPGGVGGGHERNDGVPDVRPHGDGGGVQPAPVAGSPADSAGAGPAAGPGAVSDGSAGPPGTAAGLTPAHAARLRIETEQDRVLAEGKREAAAANARLGVTVSDDKPPLEFNSAVDPATTKIGKSDLPIGPHPQATAEDKLAQSIIPPYQGGKTEMVPLMRAVVRSIALGTRAKVKGITGLFGGSGGYELALVDLFPNAKEIHLVEKNPDGAERIRYALDRGNKFMEDWVSLPAETKRQIAQTMHDAVRTGGAGSGSKLARTIRANMNGLNESQRGVLEAFASWAQSSYGGKKDLKSGEMNLEKATKLVAGYYTNLHAGAERFRRRGGEIKIITGDAYAHQVPEGHFVTHDGPYYGEKGYIWKEADGSTAGENIVSARTYGKTAAKLRELAERGHGVLFTDSGWMTKAEDRLPQDRAQAAEHLADIERSIPKLDVTRGTIGKGRRELYGLRSPDDARPAPKAADPHASPAEPAKAAESSGKAGIEAPAKTADPAETKRLVDDLDRRAAGRLSHIVGDKPELTITPEGHLLISGNGKAVRVENPERVVADVNPGRWIASVKASLNTERGRADMARALGSIEQNAAADRMAKALQRNDLDAFYDIWKKMSDKKREELVNSPELRPVAAAVPSKPSDPVMVIRLERALRGAPDAYIAQVWHEASHHGWWRDLPAELRRRIIAEASPQDRAAAEADGGLEVGSRILRDTVDRQLRDAAKGVGKPGWFGQFMSWLKSKLGWATSTVKIKPARIEAAEKWKANAGEGVGPDMPGQGEAYSVDREAARREIVARGELEKEMGAKDKAEDKGEKEAPTPEMGAGDSMFFETLNRREKERQEHERFSPFYDRLLTHSPEHVKNIAAMSDRDIDRISSASAVAGEQLRNRRGAARKIVSMLPDARPFIENSTKEDVQNFLRRGMPSDPADAVFYRTVKWLHEAGVQARESAAQAATRRAAVEKQRQEAETARAEKLAGVGKHWMSQAEDPELFRFGKNTEGRKSDAELEKIYGTKIKRSDDGKTIYFSTKDGFIKVKNAHKNVVSIDAMDAESKGKEGGGGTNAYQAAYHWAFANNKYIADEGLTHINQLRKTSNQLSSALRFGSTAHFEPGGGQGVRFREGSTLQERIGRLAEREAELVADRFPYYRELSITPEGQILRNGEALTPREINDLVESGSPKQTGVGKSTLARALLTDEMMKRDWDAGEPVDREVEGLQNRVGPLAYSTAADANLAIRRGINDQKESTPMAETRARAERIVNDPEAVADLKRRLDAHEPITPHDSLAAQMIATKSYRSILSDGGIVGVNALKKLLDYQGMATHSARVLSDAGKLLATGARRYMDRPEDVRDELLDTLANTRSSMWQRLMAAAREQDGNNSTTKQQEVATRWAKSRQQIITYVKNRTGVDLTDPSIGDRMAGDAYAVHSVQEAILDGHDMQMTRGERLREWTDRATVGGVVAELVRGNILTIASPIPQAATAVGYTIRGLGKRLTDLSLGKLKGHEVKGFTGTPEAAKELWTDMAEAARIAVKSMFAGKSIAAKVLAGVDDANVGETAALENDKALLPLWLRAPLGPGAIATGLMDEFVWATTFKQTQTFEAARRRAAGDTRSLDEIRQDEDIIQHAFKTANDWTLRGKYEGFGADGMEWLGKVRSPTKVDPNDNTKRITNWTGLPAFLLMPIYKSWAKALQEAVSTVNLPGNIMTVGKAFKKRAIRLEAEAKGVTPEEIAEQRYRAAVDAGGRMLMLAVFGTAGAAWGGTSNSGDSPAESLVRRTAQPPGTLADQPMTRMSPFYEVTQFGAIGRNLVADENREGFKSASSRAMGSAYDALINRPLTQGIPDVTGRRTNPQTGEKEGVVDQIGSTVAGTAAFGKFYADAWRRSTFPDRAEVTDKSFASNYRLTPNAPRNSAFGEVPQTRGALGRYLLGNQAVPSKTEQSIAKRIIELNNTLSAGKTGDEQRAAMWWPKLPDRKNLNLPGSPRYTDEQYNRVLGIGGSEFRQMIAKIPESLPPAEQQARIRMAWHYSYAKAEAALRPEIMREYLKSKGK